MPKYTPEQQAVLSALAEIYDNNGALTRNEARDVCGRSGQSALDTFHSLEDAGNIQFTADGSLNFLPCDEEIYD